LGIIIQLRLGLAVALAVHIGPQSQNVMRIEAGIDSREPEEALA
jgi:hypothetical protein